MMVGVNRRPLPYDGQTPYLGGMTVLIARLDSRALIRVTGPDARSFLHNLLSQDVETLKTGEMRFGALLSPPGRLLFDLFLWGEDDAVILDVAADRRDALIQRLTLYRLRAAVTVQTDDRPVLASFPVTAEGFQVDPRDERMGGRRLGAGPTPNATEADYHRHRLTVGLPDPATDAGDDRTYPIEANFDLLNGVDFKKGCFIGQETTSRMKRRGAIRNRMAVLEFDGAPPPPGTEVLNGDLRAGDVRGGQDGMAIALLRLDRLVGELTADGRPVRVRLPDGVTPAEPA